MSGPVNSGPTVLRFRWELSDPGADECGRELSGSVVTQTRTRWDRRVDPRWHAALVTQITAPAEW